jgi:predicted metal-dependent HD superfamily phosphohydrolase
VDTRLGNRFRGKFLMNDALRRKWHNLLCAWAVDPTLADRTFEDVREHYCGPSRFYHTLDHVQTVLETVGSLGSYARNLNAVKLATWLHDVIYDSRASDNEERSADYAERLCEKLSIPEGRLVAATGLSISSACGTLATRRGTAPLSSEVGEFVKE